LSCDRWRGALEGMLKAAKYSVVELLPNGRRIEIRALKPEDQADFVAAIDRISARSLYRRFFGLRRHFSEKETNFFLNVDFADHVALVALVREGGRARWLSLWSTNTRDNASGLHYCATSSRLRATAGSRNLLQRFSRTTSRC
jgi:hypothetical protein